MGKITTFWGDFPLFQQENPQFGHFLVKKNVKMNYFA